MAASLAPFLEVVRAHASACAAGSPPPPAALTDALSELLPVLQGVAEEGSLKACQREVEDLLFSLVLTGP